MREKEKLRREWREEEGLCQKELGYKKEKEQRENIKR